MRPAKVTNPTLVVASLTAVMLAGCLDDGSGPQFLAVERDYGFELLRIDTGPTVSTDDITLLVGGIECDEQGTPWVNSNLFTAQVDVANRVVIDGWAPGERILVTPGAMCPGWSPQGPYNYTLLFGGERISGGTFSMVHRPEFRLDTHGDSFNLTQTGGRVGYGPAMLRVIAGGTECTLDDGPATWSVGSNLSFEPGGRCPSWVPSTNDTVRVVYDTRILLEQAITVDYDPRYFVVTTFKTPQGGADAELSVERAVTYWKDRGHDIRIGSDQTGRHQIRVQFIKEFDGTTIGQHSPGKGGLTQVAYGASPCNDSEWLAYDQETVDDTTTHEIGHALGLKHDAVGIMAAKLPVTYTKPCQIALFTPKALGYQDTESLNFWSPGGKYHVRVSGAENDEFEVCLFDHGQNESVWCQDSGNGTWLRDRIDIPPGNYTVDVTCTWWPSCQISGNVGRWMGTRDDVARDE